MSLYFEFIVFNILNLFTLMSLQNLHDFLSSVKHKIIPIMFPKNYPKALNTYHKSDPYDWNSDLFNESFDPVHIVKMHLNVSYINQTFLFPSQTCQIVFLWICIKSPPFSCFHLVGGRFQAGLALVNDLLEVSENCPWPILHCTKPQKSED